MFMIFLKSQYVPSTERIPESDGHGQVKQFKGTFD